MHLSLLCRLWNHLLCYVTDSIANLCICHCCVVCEIIFCVMLLIRLLIYASVIVVSSDEIIFCVMLLIRLHRSMQSESLLCRLWNHLLMLCSLIRLLIYDICHWLAIESVNITSFDVMFTDSIANLWHLSLISNRICEHNIFWCYVHWFDC